MNEPVKVDVSYENSGYDTLTLRAIATVTTDKGKQSFRGSWVNDGNVKALESLIGEIVRATFERIGSDQIRHLEESRIMQGKLDGLRAEVDEMRNDATRSGLSTLMARSKEVQLERNALHTEATKQKATLARVRAAINELIEAVREA